MGCCISPQSGGLRSTQHMVEQERKAKDQVGANLTAAVDRIKDRLQSQMKDPEMLRRILEIALSYSALKLEGSNQMANKCFISLTGEYLASSSNNFPAPFCKAVTSLATPKDLSRIDNFENSPFDRNLLFNKIKKKHDETPGSSAKAKAMPKQYPKKKAKAKAAASSDGPSLALFDEVRADMMGFIEPCFELLEQCPLKMKSDGNLDENKLREVMHQLASAAMAVKTYDPAQGETPLRVAFVGAESVGKSTLINHLTSEGRGDEFMPVTTGQGTQTMCICSHGDSEMLSIDGVQHFGSGQVEKLLRADQEEMIKATSAVAAMKVIRATKPFHPPFPVDLLDVPGIRQEKQFETSLALGISAVLVVCLGDLEKMSLNFEREGSSLSLLPELWAASGKLPIVGAVTQCKAPRAEFNEAGYRSLLQSKFPGADVKVVFANFFAMPQDEKPNGVLSFYKMLLDYKVKEANPFELFRELQHPTQQLVNEIWKTIQSDPSVKSRYIDKFESVKDRCRGEFKKLREKCSRPEALETTMNKRPVKNELKAKPKGMPVFSVMAQAVVMAQVVEWLTISQEMVFELRMDLIRWLQTLGKLLHTDFISGGFQKIYHLVIPDSEDHENEDARYYAEEAISEVVVQTCLEEAASRVNPVVFNFDDQGASLRLLEERTTNHIARFLGSSDFPWVVTGYYLLTVDGYMVSQLIGRFTSGQQESGGMADFFKPQEKTDIEKWTDQIVSMLKGVPYLEWHNQCRKAQKEGDRHSVFSTILVTMEEACHLFTSYVDKSELCTSFNPFLNGLLKICFASLQRLIVKKSVTDGGDYSDTLVYTTFGRRLRDGARDLEAFRRRADRLKQCDVMDVEKESKELVNEMRAKKNSMPKEWKDKGGKLQEMEELLEEIARFTMGANAQRSAITKGVTSKVLVLCGPHETVEGLEGGALKYGKSIPGLIVDALQTLASQQKEKMIHFAEKGLDLMTYGKAAVKKACAEGASVIICVKDVSEPTADPVGFEQFLLQALKEEPHITHCFVITTNDSWKNITTDKKARGKFEEQAGEDVKMNLLYLNTPESKNEFLSAVDKALKETKEEVNKRVKKMKDSLAKAKNTMCDNAQAYEQLRTQFLSKDPRYFQNFMTEEPKKQLKKEDKDLGLHNASTWEIPPAAWLEAQPDFVKKVIDDVQDEDAKDLEELPVRNRLMTIMLGQVIKKADMAAEKAYKKVMEPVFEMIGKEFGVSGRAFKDEMKEFAARILEEEGHEGSQDLEVERGLIEFVDEKHFKLMYIGCVLWSTVPIAYGTILPCLYIKKSKTISFEDYKSLNQRAISILTTGSTSKEAGFGVSQSVAATRQWIAKKLDKE